MSLPNTYEAFRRTTGNLPLSIEKSTETLSSQLKANEVLIRVHAVTLNYRDVAMLIGRYPMGSIERGIPTSDCAGEVVALGDAVKNFTVGDHVSPIFFFNLITGKEKSPLSGTGGEIDGMLRQYAVVNQEVLVHLPKHLSWEEAASITCAGTTAWNSLNMPESQGKADTALLIGTGGVSMFALLICLNAGIRPIITSSSDAKLESIRGLAPEGVIDTVNYSTFPDWEKEVLRLTDGQGVDIVVENGGPVTIGKSLASLRTGGQVSLVGFLGGSTPDPIDVVIPMISKGAVMKGIRVGSKVDQQKLCDFLEEKKVGLQTILDKTFSFEDSKAAFDHLLSAKHVGKVVIKI